jgi:hypothetical protein
MLLILVPADLAAPLEKLRKHKVRTGVPTRIVTLEKVYKTGYAGDEAEQVKRCVADHYQSERCRYVLLVGDADVFPVRYTTYDREDAAAWNTAFFPTDLYYACLYRPNGDFDTWDGNDNGHYGELHGETRTGAINVDDVSLLPQVAVGRVPASTRADVDTFVGKSIAYETNAAHARWPWVTLLVATHDWGPVGWASGVQMRAAEGPMSLHSSTVLITRGRSQGDFIASDAVTAAFNRGVGIVGYVGHGRNDDLAIPSGEWGVDDIPDLTNTTAWPVMLAAACNTAGFATLPPYAEYVDVNGVAHPGSTNHEIFASVPPPPSCLQTWVDPDDDLATNITVRTVNGAVAYFGGVTGMQNSEPVELLMAGLARATTLGDAWREMIKSYYLLPDVPRTLATPSWTGLARFHQPWKYMLFGDPSLRIHGVGTPGQARAVLTVA